MIERYVQTDLEQILETLALVRSVKKAIEKKSFKAKLEWLLSQEKVKIALSNSPQLSAFIASQKEESLYIIGLLILTGQFDAILEHLEEGFAEKLCATIQMLIETEHFYASIGGLLGYIEKTLLIFCGQEKHPESVSFLAPPFYDMREKTKEVWQAVFEGIQRLSETGELYTVGGAGDRLKLVDEKTGLPVPVAYLSFCGRPLFEHLFRDLEAREYVHFQTFGRQVSAPVLLMTSLEKANDQAIEAMVEKYRFFGRDKSRILRIVQSLVPLIASNGKFVFKKPLELAGKPGGHGVIWKIAHDAGAFSWLRMKGAKALLVRQINNPLAGLDHTLSALLGFGLSHNKAFGFASCPRRKGFAEGLNIAMADKKAKEATISNIEYTKFEHLTHEEARILHEQEIPANTNILFADIDCVEEAIKKNPLPGLIVNAKNQCEFVENGQVRIRSAARLESTMQNIADTMMVKVSSFEPDEMKKELSTFLQLYERSKLISVTKNAYHGETNPHETPESCFYDWYTASYHLLNDFCSFSLPPLQSLAAFLQEGPSLLFFFHPALGPFWEVISQKLHGGALFPHSELDLEIAEAYLENILLKGSFRILSDSPTGQTDNEGIRRYAKAVPRAFFKNVSLTNKGLLPASISDQVKRNVQRSESCTIHLEGVSEVVAEDLTISGNFALRVPHGKRAILTQAPSGTLNVRMEDLLSPSWEYTWKWDGTKAPELLLRR